MRVGLLSFSDGRERVHRDLIPEIKKAQDVIIDFLKRQRGIEVVAGSSIVYTPDLARREARRLVAQNIDALVFNIPVFAFPNFALIAARICNISPLIYSLPNPRLPGLGGMLAAGGGLREAGINCEKLWGDLGDPLIQKKFMAYLRAQTAARKLQGQVYGLIGGRSIGMVTGTIDPSQWMEIFGVDVEHVDQLEIIRLAEKIPEVEVNEGFKWLNSHVGKIEYAGALSEESLKYQLRCYLAIQEIVKQHQLDFLGVKCHYELSEYYVTQCLSCAICSDPYDWRGPKPPQVFACEADSDGALTMQILKLLSGKPTAFLDLRHYDEANGLYVLCNCGALATWFAAQAEDPNENLKRVTLCPIIPKYAGKGAHVRFLCSSGEVTFARLMRSSGRYQMVIFKGEFVEVPLARLQETCPQWPHAYAKINIGPQELFDIYDSNHCHAVYGDYLEEIVKFCKILNIDVQLIERRR